MIDRGLPLRPLRRYSALVAAVGYLPLPAAERAAHPGQGLLLVRLRDEHGPGRTYTYLAPSWLAGVFHAPQTSAGKLFNRRVRGKLVGRRIEEGRT